MLMTALWSIAPHFKLEPYDNFRPFEEVSRRESSVDFIRVVIVSFDKLFMSALSDQLTFALR